MKLDIKLEHCYGIGSLEHKLDLTENKSSIIYAANGIMKTSLAKTFFDYSVNQITADRINPNKITLRKINVDEQPLSASKLFVIKPYDDSFESESISALLVNKELKYQYESITKSIIEKKNDFINHVSKISDIKKDDVEDIIHQLQGIIGTSIFDTLLSFRDLVEMVNIPNKENFATVNYLIIFHDKVQKILQDDSFKKDISEYIDSYNNLINNSHFFKNTFAPYNADSVAKNLKDNGYFDAEHSINIIINNKKIEIKDIDSLTTAIKEEKDSILSDIKLVSIFEKLEIALNKNNETRKFRDYIKGNKFIIPALSNLDSLKRTLFVSYFIKNKDIYLGLMDEYKNSREQINEVIRTANQEKTQWQKVINIFNNRFFVPFTLKISNQDGVMLKGEVPYIEFKYANRDISRKDLVDILSTGEKRALYLLNIIFEIEARKHSSQETLFIADDIAESFDYKNKYAIVQYIKELTETANFYTILLTHNFDFFRTVQNRVQIHRNNCFQAVKSDNGNIQLTKMKYIGNPTKYWAESLGKNKRYLIPLIPFARNIIEYTNGEDNIDYKILTSLLHFKKDTLNITVHTLLTILKNVFNIIDKGLSTDIDEQSVVEFIFNTSETIITKNLIELDDKIILSIAIRLHSEKYLINTLEVTDDFSKNQFFELHSRYSNFINKNNGNMEILDNVLMMTPETIHVNSFMYEPIIDLSPDHLVKLYNEVKNLT